MVSIKKVGFSGDINSFSQKISSEKVRLPPPPSVWLENWWNYPMLNKVIALKIYTALLWVKFVREKLYVQAIFTFIFIKSADQISTYFEQTILELLRIFTSYQRILYCEWLKYISIYISLFFFSHVPSDHRHVICPRHKLRCFQGFGVCAKNVVRMTIYKELRISHKRNPSAKINRSSKVLRITFNKACSCQIDCNSYPF